MGKLEKPIKTQMSRSIRVVKQSPISKHVNKILQKRILMLQRRNQSLLSEKCSIEEKNKDIVENLKAEKVLSTSLKKESFHWQRLYHESMVTVNTYKVKQAEMLQLLSTCLREIDSVYPHMVALSGSVTNNKLRITDMMGQLSSSDYNCLPRQFRNSGNINIDEDAAKISEKLMRRRVVGPMVKGLLIKKPKIMLERVMLPQPQDQGPVNVDMPTIEVTNPLTPIAEENEEEAHIRNISMRPRYKLGKSWLIKQQAKLDKEREQERSKGNNKSSTAVSYDGDSSDSGNDLIEPVVRFKDVSRMLQNSSLLQVDAALDGENDSGGSSGERRSQKEDCHIPGKALKKPVDDPLEGSSWMFNSNNHCTAYQPQNIEQKRSSIYKFDSSSDSDDDNGIVPQNNLSNLSPMDTLVMRRTFTIPSNSNSLSTAGSSRNSLEASPTAEPDSTNNIDTLLPNSYSFNSSSFSSTSHDKSRTLKNTPIEENPSHSSKSQPQQNTSTNSSLLSLCLSKCNTDKRLSPSTNTTTQNTTQPTSGDAHVGVQNILEGIGKRVRKPKNFLYPSEEDAVPAKKSNTSKPPRLITGRKSLSNKKKSTDKTTTKKGLSTEIGSNSNEGTIGGSDKKAKGSVKEITVKMNPKPKKSSVKRSIYTPRNSSSTGGRNQSTEELARPKRNKSNVCYKESPLNTKQRRP